jgi:hypothetical protein
MHDMLCMFKIRLWPQKNYDLDCLGLGLLSELFGFGQEVWHKKPIEQLRCVYTNV